MLAKVEKYNRKAEEIIKERRQRLCEKIKRKSHRVDGMTKIARCDKLWKQKSRKARRDDQEEDTTCQGGADWTLPWQVVEERQAHSAWWTRVRK